MAFLAIFSSAGESVSQNRGKMVLLHVFHWIISFQKLLKNIDKNSNLHASYISQKHESGSKSQEFALKKEEFDEGSPSWIATWTKLKKRAAILV
jgi:hypothetical protein